jgi:hypothetical protein
LEFGRKKEEFRCVIQNRAGMALEQQRRKHFEFLQRVTARTRQERAFQAHQSITMHHDTDSDSDDDHEISYEQRCANELDRCDMRRPVREIGSFLSLADDVKMEALITEKLASVQRCFMWPDKSTPQLARTMSLCTLPQHSTDHLTQHARQARCKAAVKMQQITDDMTTHITRDKNKADHMVVLLDAFHFHHARADQRERILRITNKNALCGLMLYVDWDSVRAKPLSLDLKPTVVGRLHTSASGIGMAAFVQTWHLLHRWFLYRAKLHSSGFYISGAARPSSNRELPFTLPLSHEITIQAILRGLCMSLALATDPCVVYPESLVTLICTVCCAMQARLLDFENDAISDVILADLLCVARQHTMSELVAMQHWIFFRVGGASSMHTHLPDAWADIHLLLRDVTLSPCDSAWRHFYANVALPALLPFDTNDAPAAVQWISVLCHSSTNETGSTQPTSIPDSTWWLWRREYLSECNAIVTDSLFKFEQTYVRTTIASNKSGAAWLAISWRRFSAAVQRAIFEQDPVFYASRLPLHNWGVYVQWLLSQQAQQHLVELHYHTIPVATCVHHIMRLVRNTAFACVERVAERVLVAQAAHLRMKRAYELYLKSTIDTQSDSHQHTHTVARALLLCE